MKFNFSQLFDLAHQNFMVKTSKGKVKYVNLDNAATTIPFKKVKGAINEFLNSYGSIHRGTGQKSKISTEAFEKARETIRIFAGASEQNYVIFTKNTTESINQAAALWANKKGKVLVSDIEHSSNLLPWMKYNEIIQYKTSNEGVIILSEIERAFIENKDIKLIVITGASNVTGYKTPIYKIAEIAHKNRAKILVDACQYIQHKKLDMKADSDIQHIDFVAFSGHKMYAPYGAGVLIGPKDFFDENLPYQIGGGNLPYITNDLKIKRFKTVRSHDPGTANAVGIIAISEAIKVIESIGYSEIERYEEEITSKAFDEIAKITGIKFYIRKENLGNIIPFDLEGFDSKLLAEILAQEQGIGVRAGSFCTYELMRKLKGISKERDNEIAKEVDNGITANIPGLVRASFALSNSLEDVKRFVEALKEISQKGAEYYKKFYKQDIKTGSWNIRTPTNVKPNELNYDSYSMEKYDRDIKRSIPGHDKLHAEIGSFLKKEYSEKKNVKVLELGIGTGL